MERFYLEKNESVIDGCDSKNFELIKSLITCKELLEHKDTLPKIISLLDSIKRYVDLKNEQTKESLTRQKEYEMIDLASKSSDLTHRQSMQQLLMDSLNSNNFTKANFIYCILNNKTIDTNFLNNTNNQFSNKTFVNLNSNKSNLNKLNNKNTFSNDIIKQNNNNNNIQQFNRTPNQTKNIPISNSVHDKSNINQNKNSITPTKTNHLSNNLNNSHYNKSYSNDVNMGENGQVEDKDVEFLNEESPVYNQQTNKTPLISFNSTLGSENNNQSFNFTNRTLSKVILMNQKTPYRHIICSNGLEFAAKKSNILVLYKGKCHGNCYANKPWVDTDHYHYIVNCTDCNDHVSRLVKKCGIEFYNSFLIDNVERQNQLRIMYNMQKVN